MVVMHHYIPYQNDYERHRLDRAATVIQAHIRRFLAVKLVEKRRYQRELEIQEKHAIILQAHIRRFLASRRVERIRAERSASPMDREARRISEEKAAIKIQAHIRKFLASRRVERIRARQRALRQIKERHAATVIQRFYRSYRNQKFEKAAIVLQSNIRMFLALRRYKRYKLNAEKQLNAEEKMEVDQPQVMERIQNSIKKELIDEKLNAVCDHFISETTKAAEAADRAGPLNEKSKFKYDDYTAAVTIQRSWRGYKCRRRHSDVLEKLTKTRLSIKNAPNILENPKEHRSLCIRERIDIYMPLFRSKNLKNRQLAASFMNRITTNSSKFTEELLSRGGISAILAASSNLGRDYGDTLLMKELAELLLKCLNCPSSQEDVDKHIEGLLIFLVGNLIRHRKEKIIMAASCNGLLKLCRHSEAPGNLKKLNLSFYVSQWRKQLGQNSKSELVNSLKIAEEVLQLINALP